MYLRNIASIALRNLVLCKNNLENMLFEKSLTKTVKKGTILQREGDTHLKSFAVVKGLLRSYIIDAKGKEHIYMFGPEDWIVGDLQAAFIKGPTKLFVDALEDSEVVELEPSPEITDEMAKKGLEKAIRRVGTLQNRVLMLMSATAWERYQFFLDEYPDLYNRVPQKMIASYLGITPQALSRIRGEWARSKK
ncbi:cAMP-binding protein [Owenweeksia hongkongensis DSM 17368]|uniref:cAMP-binding protein n=2 Tax=Owenweeksia TaxID=267986 RepID=G8R603_OWEHD|nr:cAMP-binding protein [Owenweeksia hongkongensis DSM 17368]